MKKVTLLLVAMAFAVTACRKKDDTVVKVKTNDSVVVDTLQLEEGDSALIHLDTVK